MGMARKAFVSGGWIGISNGVIAIVQMIQFALLSRYLAPAEFGLIAVLMTIYFLGMTTLNAGFGSGIIAITASSKQYSSLYWLNLIVGFFTFVLLYALSPLIGVYFDAPELTKPIQIFTFIFLLIPLGTQFEYLLQKNMKFRAVSITDGMGTILEAVLCIWLAKRGYGVDAFVYGKLLYFSFRSLTFFFIGMKNYRPSFYFSCTEIQPFIKYGIYQLGTNSMFMVYSQMPKFIIPPLLGLEAMGYYELADRITMQPLYKILPIIKKVALPMIAQVQDDVNRVRKGFLYYLLSIEMIMAPITIVIALFSNDLVLLIFGKSWIAITPYVTILIVASFIRCISDSAAVLALATRRSDLDFYRYIFILCTSLTLLYSGAYFFGAIGAVWSVLFTNILSLFFGFFVIIRKLLVLESFTNYNKNLLILIIVVFFSLFNIIVNNFYLSIFIFIFFIMTYYLLRNSDLYMLIKKIRKNDNDFEI